MTIMQNQNGYQANPIMEVGRRWLTAYARQP